MTININGTTGISGVDGSAGTPAIQGSDTNTGVFFGTNTIDLSTDGTSRLSIDSSGRLLVGLTTGNNRNFLQIQGDVDNGATGVGGISLRRGLALGSIGDGSTLGQLDFCMSDGGVAARIIGEAEGSAGTDDYPGRLEFYTTADGASSPTERMRITNSGELLVGATSTTAGVYHDIRTVNAAAAGNRFALRVYNRNTNASAATLGIRINYDLDPNDTNAALNFVANSTTRAEIRNNGGIANFQSNDANLCDEREKKNIEALDSTWSCLKNWDLKKFHYNEDADTDDKRYGVIAQQVAEHCPEVITDWVKQKAEEAVLDDDGNVVTPAKEEIIRMGVKEQQMYWMAIKALQEAQTRIEILEARLSVLEGGAN